jgi:hypothetical protein
VKHAAFLNSGKHETKKEKVLLNEGEMLACELRIFVVVFVWYENKS